MNLAEIRRKAQQLETARTEWEEAAAAPAVHSTAAERPEPQVELLPLPPREAPCSGVPAPDSPEESFPEPVVECSLDSLYDLDDEDLEALDAYALEAQRGFRELPGCGAASADARAEEAFEATLGEALQAAPMPNAPAAVAATAEPPHPPSAPDAPSAPAAPQPFDPLAAILRGRETAVAGEESGTVAAEESAETVELLCFKVAQEEYAISIMDVKEIIKPRELTEVPRTPPFVGGILSLRGIIIPVFDLRVRLGLVHGARSPRERIVVVKRERGFCGVLVDQVVQVVRLPLSGFEPPPVVLEGIDREFVRGIGRVEGRMLILLDMEKVLDVTLS